MAVCTRTRHNLRESIQDRRISKGKQKYHDSRSGLIRRQSTTAPCPKLSFRSQRRLEAPARYHSTRISGPPHHPQHPARSHCRALPGHPASVQNPLNSNATELHASKMPPRLQDLFPSLSHPLLTHQHPYPTHITNDQSSVRNSSLHTPSILGHCITPSPPHAPTDSYPPEASTLHKNRLPLHMLVTTLPHIEGNSAGTLLHT